MLVVTPPPPPPWATIQRAHALLKTALTTYTCLETSNYRFIWLTISTIFQVELFRIMDRVMVINAIFNNISVILLWSVLVLKADAVCLYIDVYMYTEKLHAVRILNNFS